MSNVRKDERKPHRFTTADKALDLCTYTSKILSNEKIFTPKYQRTIDDIAYEARMIYHLVRVANDIKTDSHEHMLLRIKNQNAALSMCEDLKTDIMIAKGLFHLRASRIRYWNKLANETKKLIQNWQKSDASLLKQYGM